MGYHSIIYIFLFLPVCLLAYQLAPEKWRGRVLLAFSWIFFYLLSGKLLVYLLGTTLLTHCIGIWLTLLKTEEAKAVEGMDRKQKKVIKAEYQKKGRRVLILGILILLGVLGYLKYFDFFTTNLSYLFGHPVLEGWRPEKLLMPIGISFYTLQAIGYMTDVYWEPSRQRQKSGEPHCFSDSSHRSWRDQSQDIQMWQILCIQESHWNIEMWSMVM